MSSSTTTISSTHSQVSPSKKNRPTLPVIALSVDRFLRPIPRFFLHSLAFPEGTDFSDYEAAKLGLAYSQSLFGPAPAWIQNVATGEIEHFNVSEDV
jgi:hypothetical protein